MKNLQFGDFGVTELSSIDAAEISGGGFWAQLGAILGVAAAICGLIAAIVYE